MDTDSSMALSSTTSPVTTTLTSVKNKMTSIGLLIKKMSYSLCGNSIQLFTLCMVYPDSNTIRKKMEFLLEMVDSLNFTEDPNFRQRSEHQVKKIHDFITQKYNSIGMNFTDFKCAIHLLFPTNPTTNDIIDMAIPLHQYIYHQKIHDENIHPTCKFNWEHAQFRLEFACVYRWYSDMALWILSIKLNQVNPFMFKQFLDMLEVKNVPYEWIQKQDNYLNALIEKMIVKYSLQSEDIMEAINPIWNINKQSIMKCAIKFLIDYYKKYIDSITKEMQETESTFSFVMDTNDNLEKDLKRLKTSP